ncbi:hypothetical protein LEP1GSC185_0610 [Leptospira licerasiae serovar Varillal str. VAR 010]|uniref:Uncharacterized protein n=1 Tax=Leptospira licerasiae str. MMD4847 TaxID=1049971 RepID=A0ABN0H7C1_9LEPT|nr:hypothetical protein LEP1GSC185_0610 [Leptospira licerasiae serovar Varillal str. VAR 010]EJZ41525.1 hypothetical protein LEP1GSC178_3934 [Leptospira licerasiae str. MMD4847]
MFMDFLISCSIPSQSIKRKSHTYYRLLRAKRKKSILTIVR